MCVELDNLYKVKYIITDNNSGTDFRTISINYRFCYQDKPKILKKISELINRIDLEYDGFIYIDCFVLGNAMITDNVKIINKIVEYLDKNFEKDEDGYIDLTKDKSIEDSYFQFKLFRYPPEDKSSEFYYDDKGNIQVRCTYDNRHITDRNPNSQSLADVFYDPKEIIKFIEDHRTMNEDYYIDRYLNNRLHSGPYIEMLLYMDIILARKLLKEQFLHHHFVYDKDVLVFGALENNEMLEEIKALKHMINAKVFGE